MLSSNILNYVKYAKISLQRDKKTRKFFDSKAIFNKNTGEIKTIVYNKDWHLRQSYLYNTFRIDYLNQECLKNDMTPIFLTLTLPSEFHPSSKKFDEKSVSDGYKELNKIFRNLYNNFKVNNTRVELKFIRVIEPHKSFVPHLHAIVYVPDVFKMKFLKHFNNIVKLYSFKQTDIKILDSSKYAVVYLLKYVDKTLRGDDVYRGWRIHHGIHRVLTMSNLSIGITREVFKHASNVIAYNKDDERCYLSQILDKIYIQKIVKDKFLNTVEVKEYGNLAESKFNYYLEITKYKKVSEITDDEELNLLDEIIYEDDYSFMIDSFYVLDEYLSEIFNSKDIKIVDSNYCLKEVGNNKDYFVQLEVDNYRYIY